MKVRVDQTNNYLADYEQRMMTKEWTLLVHCCKLAIKDNTSDLPSFILPTSIDWEGLLRLATQYRVRTLLYKGLLKWKYKEQIPAIFLAQLKAINFQIIAKNLRYTQELRQLLLLFHQSNIDVIPYKGVLLAEIAYGDGGAREYSDLDFLINMESLPIFIKILERRKYQPELNIPSKLLPYFLRQHYEYNFDLIENGKRLFHIEPHWSIGPKMYQLDITYTDFLPFIIKKQYYKIPITTLNASGLLLSTCLHHGGQDNWSKLKHVVDVAAILQQFGKQLDWTTLLMVATKWKVKNILLLGLALAESLFAVQLEDNIHALLKTKKMQDLLEDRIAVIQQVTNPPIFSREAILGRLKFHLLLREHWSTKVKIVYYHLVKFIVPNENDVEATQETTANYWLLLLKKPFRLFSKYAK